MPTALPPTVVNLVVAEGVHRDFAGKATILGVFHSYFSRQFPTTIPHLALYIALTDGRGEVRVTARLVDATDEDAPPVVSQALSVTFPGPLEVVHLSLELTAVVLPRPGLYRWQLVSGGQIIADQRFVGVLLGAKPPGRA